MTRIPQYHNIATGDIVAHGVIFSLDTDTGKCVDIKTFKE
jgi:hypothetical protein